MQIEFITNQNIQRVCTLYAEIFNQEPWNENWTIDTASERFHEFLMNPMTIGYELLEDGVTVAGIIGHKTTFMEEKEFHIDEFFVTQKLQGKGYGTKIIEFLITELKKININCITLQTKRGFPSEEFYKKKGFQSLDSLIFMYKHI